MSIFKRLKADHELQRRLAERIMQTSGDSPDRRDAFATLKREIEAHASAEEQSLYATMMALPAGQPKARHSTAEHKEAADILEELTQLEMSSGAWLRRFEHLKQRLEHHLDEEEREIFPAANKLLSSSDVTDLAVIFDERKALKLKD